MLKRNPQNRRIYDHEAKRYVPVTQVRTRLLEGEPVLCKTSGDNVTVIALLSLLRKDIEQGRGPKTEAFRQFILSYGLSDSTP